MRPFPSFDFGARRSNFSPRAASEPSCARQRVRIDRSRLLTQNRLPTRGCSDSPRPTCGVCCCRSEDSAPAVRSRRIASAGSTTRPFSHENSQPFGSGRTRGEILSRRRQPDRARIRLPTILAARPRPLTRVEPAGRVAPEKLSDKYGRSPPGRPLRFNAYGAHHQSPGPTGSRLCSAGRRGCGRRQEA